MIESISPPRAATGGSLPGLEAVPDAQGRMVGPFALLATFGPMQLQPGFARDLDVRPHPHIGMGVLAYLTQGEVTHRDDLGNLHHHRAGEASWMVAGRGIVHSERAEQLRRRGGTVEGLIAFVALPKGPEHGPPSWEHATAEQIPVLRQAGAEGRLLLGSSRGQHSFEPPSPAYLIHWTLAAGAVLRCDPDQPERGLLIISGSLDGSGSSYEAGQMLTLEPGEVAELRASSAATVVEFGGATVGPRYRWWNFLASNLETIEAAKVRWLRDDRPLPRDEQEYTPLPAEDERPLLLLQAGASWPERRAQHAA